MSDIPWIRAKRAIEEIRTLLAEADPRLQRSLTELRDLIDQVQGSVSERDVTKREATWLAADAVIIRYGLGDWQQLLDATIDSIQGMVRTRQGSSQSETEAV
jgi:signal transduction histidine kinase